MSTAANQFNKCGVVVTTDWPLEGSFVVMHQRIVKVVNWCSHRAGDKNHHPEVRAAYCQICFVDPSRHFFCMVFWLILIIRYCSTTDARFLGLVHKNLFKHSFQVHAASIENVGFSCSFRSPPSTQCPWKKLSANSFGLLVAKRSGPLRLHFCSCS